MGGIVAVGGGREPEEKTIVVVVSAVAGEGEERGKGEGERFAVATTARGCGGYKREGGRVPRGGEIVDTKWGVRRVEGWKRRTWVMVEGYIVSRLVA